MAQISIDTYIGQRMRFLRELSGQTQSELAAKLGISSQQMQKYETGKCRIRAERLWHISRILETNINFFFENIEQTAGKKQIVLEKDNKRQAVHLLGDYHQIKDERISRAVCVLVSALKN